MTLPFDKSPEADEVHFRRFSRAYWPNGRPEHPDEYDPDWRARRERMNALHDRAEAIAARHGWTPPPRLKVVEIRQSLEEFKAEQEAEVRAAWEREKANLREKERRRLLREQAAEADSGLTRPVAEKLVALLERFASGDIARLVTAGEISLGPDKTIEQAEAEAIQDAQLMLEDPKFADLAPRIHASFATLGVS